MFDPLVVVMIKLLEYLNEWGDDDKSRRMFKNEKQQQQQQHI